MEAYAAENKKEGAIGDVAGDKFIEEIEGDVQVSDVQCAPEFQSKHKVQELFMFKTGEELKVSKEGR